MQDRSVAREDRCKTGHLKITKKAEKDMYSLGHAVQDRSDAGQDGNRTDAGQDRCRTGRMQGRSDKMQNMTDAGQVSCNR